MVQKGKRIGIQIDVTATPKHQNGDIFIQETEIELKELVPKLTAITNNKLDTKIYIRGDAIIDYGRVMRVLGELSGSGFTKVALITKPLIE